MTDMDFDELDKAVNSLMKPNDTATPAKATADSSSSAEAPAATQPAEVSSAVNTSPAPTPNPPVAAQPSVEPTSPAAKRRGTFMDVVHPSSNMRKNTATAAPSREGVAVTPPSPTTPTTPPSSPQTPTTPSTQPSTQSVATLSAPTQSRQPSDVDLTNQLTDLLSEQSATSSNPQPTNEKQPMTEQPSIKEVESDSSPAPTSPFLPDAKVEKRPLGSPAPSTSTEPVPELTPEPATDTTTAPTEPNPTVELPVELSGKVMEIEADKGTTEAGTHLEKAPRAIPAAEKPAVSAPAKVTDKADAKLAASTSPQPTPSASIPQQYTEKSVDKDEQQSAIYDPAYYQQEMKHPEKKKSSWGIVFGILALILLGAGGAVLYYFFSTGAF